ncbi:hypothetical protein B0J18DRAFT_126529 [Chaetomium sp. MPI-SDFR-AT-0129]|nr:hypothetical protein B0J18DRAFT_126529 [Chaetomium sp. MPI-SDFR-AT-0129]
MASSLCKDRDSFSHPPSCYIQHNMPYVGSGQVLNDRFSRQSEGVNRYSRERTLPETGSATGELEPVKCSALLYRGGKTGSSCPSFARSSAWCVSSPLRTTPSCQKFACLTRCSFASCSIHNPPAWRQTQAYQILSSPLPPFLNWCLSGPRATAVGFDLYPAHFLLPVHLPARLSFLSWFGFPSAEVERWLLFLSSRHFLPRSPTTTTTAIAVQQSQS